MAKILEGCTFALLDGKASRQIWVREIAPKTILWGDGILATLLCEKLKRRRLSVPSRSVCGNLDRKEYLICAFDKLSLAQMRKLTDFASNADVFLLFVTRERGDQVRLGPMIAPRIPGSIQASILEGVTVSSSPGVGARQRKLSDRVVDQAADLLVRSLAARTYPLLWTTLRISKDRVRQAPLTNTGLATAPSHSEKVSIGRWLSPGLWRGKRSLSLLERRLPNGDLVAIQDAFLKPVAQTLHHALDRCGRWRPYSGGQRDFRYQHHNLYELSDYPPELLTARLFFGSVATKAWIERLSHADCRGDTALSASWYKPGDHSLPHTDNSEQRAVSFVWHLTRNWPSKRGGHLLWCETGRSISPEFNSLYLFKVSDQSHHRVTPVVPRAPGKRLAVNGWWRRQVYPGGASE